MEIYVGNLTFETSRDELREEFEAFGKVKKVKVITDRPSGR
jgi:RNA recognition motif-containing protein